ncbi:DNA-binding transcriptional ArsR family regulator [Paenibacillus forsythiae]|uniref:DNA-binding transcriptional ArsR family regulator n=1 Tax=Paenibacillus forsythiae TaxID=365616 RepID=A0ABU3H1L0_9BACL|nr:helix-turn-helix domain-containing protein [Paenibacillus forsythiae]MDT3424703.1 DNA-binding transcriptional ArsR family regulator [Paenibacillus forsythiae]
MEYELKIDVSPVYELIDSFMLYVTRKWISNLDIGPEWVRDLDGRIPPPKIAALRQAAEWPFEDYDVLYAWAYIHGPSAKVQLFLEDMESATVEEWFELAAPYLPGFTLEECRRIKDGYGPLLRLWHEQYFRHVESKMLPLLIEDASEKKLLQSKMEQDALIEYASGGIVIEDIPELETIVLLPTVHHRPINTYCSYKKLMLVQYPVDVPVENEDEPPTLLLRMTKALSDPVRLRLLRYLANEPKSLWEMQSDLGQSGDILMHHLMMLRVAGLLRVHLREEQNDRFSIRLDGASELQMFLESYIRL